MQEKKTLTNSKLKPFRQHGFLPDKKSGNNQVMGNCVFCGKEKFFVNIENQLWDCKVCNESGNMESFLYKLWGKGQKLFKGALAEGLAKDRNLDVQTLKEAKIGWNPITKAFLFPILGFDGKKLHDLKTYKNKKLMVTSGKTQILYGAEYIQQGFYRIWLCEGEWDALALREAIQNTDKKQLKSEAIMAVPGASTFKRDWISFFKGTRIKVLFDNDEAGKSGAEKLYNLLQPITKEIKFLHWQTKDKPGKDIRDLYTGFKKDGKKLLDTINKRLKDIPQGIDKENVKSNKQKPKIKFTGKYFPIEEIRDVYTKWLRLKNPYVVDVMLAVSIANRFPGVPVWLFLVGSSGCGKSELIMSLKDVENVEELDHLTTHTLISGGVDKDGSDPSLLARIDGKIITMKDYTTVFALPREQQAQITSQLRNAYDGEASSTYGSGIQRKYDANFGLIAGVTPIVDKYMEGETNLGERWLRWRIHEPKTMDSELDVIDKALSNTGSEDVMKTELREAAKKALHYDYLKRSTPVIPDDIYQKLKKLAYWVSLMRGSVDRRFITNEILRRPVREIATRVAKQFIKELWALGLLRGKKIITTAEYNLLKHLAASTIPMRNFDILKIMYLSGKEKDWSPRDVIDRTGFPETTILMVFEDLRMLKVLEKLPKTFPAKFRITKEIIHILETTRMFRE